MWRDQSWENCPPPSSSTLGGREACEAQADHPAPASQAAGLLLACSSKPPEAQNRLLLLERPLIHPLSYRRHRLGEGASRTPGVKRMPTCSRLPVLEAAGRGCPGWPHLRVRQRCPQGTLISHSFLCSGPISGPHLLLQEPQIIMPETGLLVQPTLSIPGPRGAYGASVWKGGRTPLQSSELPGFMHSVSA